MNCYLEPLVKELLKFEAGIIVKTLESPCTTTLRARLLCVACDVPAARKVCGFMGHNATQGCSKCTKKFPRREGITFLSFPFFFSFFFF